MTGPSSQRRLSFCNCGLSHGGGLNRRDLLAGGAAALFGAMAPGVLPKASAQTKPHRIDVHHHIVPPTWLDMLKSTKRDSPPLTNLVALAHDWGIQAGNNVVVDVSGMGRMIGTDASVPVVAPPYPAHPTCSRASSSLRSWSAPRGHQPRLPARRQP